MDFTGLAAHCTAVGPDVVANQKVGWRPDAWLAMAQESPVSVGGIVDQLVGEWTGHGTIRRSFVAGLDDPLELFVAAMAWGFGDDPRGPARVLKMLGRPRDPDGSPVEVVAGIVEDARAKGAAAFASLWSDGRSRIYGLGTAFGTKVLHFAAKGAKDVHDPAPLVLDLNVWRGASVVPGAVVPNPKRSCTTEMYTAYCAWAATAVPGVPGEVVEYVLFQGGKGHWPQPLSP